MKMRQPLEFVGRGAKWSVLVFQLACLLNPYLVIGVDESSDDISTSESRSPYIYLSKQEYVVNPSSGQYELVTSYPSAPAPSYDDSNYTSTPSSISTTTTSSTESYLQKRSSNSPDQHESSSSQTNQRFIDNRFTRYNFNDNSNTDTSTDNQQSAESNNNPSSIRDILGHRQLGQYVTTTISPTYQVPSQDSNSQSSPSYDAIAYQSPLVGYEVPSNYFPNEHYDWPSTYGPPPQPYGPPIHHGNPAHLVAPFLGGVSDLTSSVKHIKSTIGEQKAKTAYQVAEVVKNTGHAVNNAIVNKGHVAGQVVGQALRTAGEAINNKGWSAQQVIANKGHLAKSAITSVGNIGSSLLRSKGELIGAVLKTGTAIGTTALGTASNALQGGTYLVKAKGEAASNLISKGGKIASGVIGTKGRLISSVINAKGHFVAQIVEAKGRAAATLLETSGQKLTQLAEAIKSATSQKRPGGGWGWSSGGGGGGDLGPGAYGAPSEKEEQREAELQQEEPQPVRANHQHAHQYQQDYRDTYYSPGDQYSNQGSIVRAQSQDIQQQNQQQIENDEDGYYGQKINNKRSSNDGRGRGRSSVREQEQDLDDQEDLNLEQDEDFQNEYSSYYQPYHYSGGQGGDSRENRREGKKSPSEYQQYPVDSQYQYE